MALVLRLLLGGAAGAALAFLFGNRPELARRLKLALKVGVIGYVALYLVRLVLLPPTASGLQTLAIVVAVFGLIWLATRLAVFRANR